MEWKLIETAPSYERVWVAGWQPKNGNTVGYWWRRDDVVIDGVDVEHQSATHWCPHNTPPYPEETTY